MTNILVTHADEPIGRRSYVQPTRIEPRSIRKIYHGSGG